MSTPIYDEAAWDHGFAPMPPLDDEQANLAARLLRDLTNPTPCRRCDGVPDSPRTCAACCNELVAAAERDAGAQATLTWMRAGIDDTGRTDPSRWGW